MPISKANQLNSGTTRGAAANMATVNKIFTSSQPKRPTIALPTDARFRATPRENTTAGNTTDNAPYATDRVLPVLVVTSQAINVAINPIPT